jgi:hypothetical protein
VAKLIYSAITSLDGYIADDAGTFEWAMPDAEVHTLVNDLERPVGTYLYGRRMYEVMVFWETVNIADQLPHIRDYAEIWRAADKVVYSKTLEGVSSARTRIERKFDPEAVRTLKAEACQLFLTPILVGGGTRSLPDGVRTQLELLDERRFGNGMVYLRYRTRN